MHNNNIAQLNLEVIQKQKQHLNRRKTKRIMEILREMWKEKHSKVHFIIYNIS